MSKTTKSGGKAWASVWIILSLAIIVGTVMLVMEFCTDRKPSNGFKKTNAGTEQTEQLSEEEERTLTGGEE